MRSVFFRVFTAPRLSRPSTPTLLLTLLLALVATTGSAHAARKGRNSGATGQSSARANFLPSPFPKPWRDGSSLAHTLEAARADGRKVAAVFSSPNCEPCREFENVSLGSQRVAKIAGRFRWAWIDAERHPSLLRQYGVVDLVNKVTGRTV